MKSDQNYILATIVTMENEAFLATIVHVEGSAYRREGVQMVIEKNGKTYGLLSGGCLEQDVIARVEQAEKNETFSVLYDLRSEDDLTWGQGLGCDGSVRVIVEPITEELKHFYQQLQQNVNRGIAVTHIKKINRHFQVEETIFIPKLGEAFGQYQHFSELNKFKESTPSMMLKDNHYYYVQHFQPPNRLIIFGAGPDCIPLASIAKNAGFYVTVSDWREGYCNHTNFPDADELIIGNPTEIIQRLNPSIHDYVVVMSHNYMKDEEIVFLLLKRTLRFLGLLGSKKRSEKLLASKNVPEWVKYPVGLPIHAEGPNEIAISIVAQLILEKQKAKQFECR